MRKDPSIHRWSKRFAVCERRSCYRPPIALLVPCLSAARNPERARPPSPAIWPLLSHKSATESCSWMRICDPLRCTDYSERKRIWVSSAASQVVRTGAPLYALGSPGLDLLFCGPVPPNPSELLSSRSMGALIRSAREQYEFIILDSAPMLALATAAFSPHRLVASCWW